MHHHYSDITKRIKEPPKWWDENAVPRYCDFAPHETANIYANEIALVGIECQSCGQRFRVAFSRSTMEDVLYPGSETLAEQIQNKTIHYGDPPNNGCCAAGPTMNSVPIRVLEFWRKKAFDAERDHSLEIPIDVDWAEL